MLFPSGVRSQQPDLHGESGGCRHFPDSAKKEEALDVGTLSVIEARRSVRGGVEAGDLGFVFVWLVLASGF